MTIGEMLTWAYEETQMADALERLISSLPEDLRPAVAKQVAAHLDRARWLDEQVEQALLAADVPSAGNEKS